MPRYYNSYYDEDNYYEDRYPWRDTVSEIYSLRRNGELGEALSLSRSAHEQYPEEDDVTKAYGWTLCSVCKEAIENNQHDLALALYDNEYKSLRFHFQDEFLDSLRKSFLYIAKQLNPFSAQIDAAIKESKEGNPKLAAEQMLSLLEQNALKKMHIEDLGWVIFRFINNYDGNQDDFPLYERCLRTYHSICGNKGSMLHSSILSALLKLSTKTNLHFDEYFNYWGIENLRPEDYQDNIFDGKAYPSLFQKICNYYVERNLNFDIASFCEKAEKSKAFIAEALRKSWFWKIYHESQNGKGESLWSMFNDYVITLSSYGPSEWHSQIMKLAIRCMVEQDANRILPFFVSWGHNFCESDWKPSVGKDGNEYAPLAGRVIKASYEALSESGENRTEHIDFLISALTDAVERNSADEWSKRNLGRLYYKKGDKSNAKKIYQDLSKILYDKYYYWQEFAHIVDDENVKAGMLAKALLIESNEDYIGEIRLELASHLIAAGNKEAASVELERYHANRVKNGWRISEKYSSLIQSIGIISANNSNNMEFYQSLAIEADEFVYKDLPWEDVVIAESWKTEENKSYVLLTDGKGDNIKAKRRSHKLLADARIGQSFQIKYEHDTSKILLIKPSSLEDWSAIPETYAYIEYVNSEKNVAHAITSNSKAIFFHYDPSRPIKKNSFARIRYFEKENKEKETKLNVVTWKICNKEDALSAFRCKVVVVDDVNMSKNLFHFILGCGLIGGIIRHSDTTLRPKIGDFIKVYYCISKDKYGKKVALAIHAEPTDEIAEGMVFTTTGFVDVQYKNDHQFGFINDYYVPEELTYDSACNGKVEAKVLNIQKGKEKVFEIKAIG